MAYWFVRYLATLNSHITQLVYNKKDLLNKKGS